MKFLGCPVSVGDKVTAHIKSSEQLIREGWLPTESGGLKKDSAYFKFNSKKREKIGKTIEGVISLNPKRNLCIKDENDWGYDESMVASFVIQQKHKYVPFEMEVDNMKVASDENGGLYIETYDSYCEHEIENYFSEDETKELIQKLLKYHRWID